MSAVRSLLQKLGISIDYLIKFMTPKRIEAVGVCILLLAAYFQLKADRDQRTDSATHIAETKYEVEYTRSKIMRLLECQRKGDCGTSDGDPVMTEQGVFEPQTDADWYQRRRYLFFGIGSLLVVVGKWFDGKPRAT
jgi:hypothetical protein